MTQATTTAGPAAPAAGGGHTDQKVMYRPFRVGVVDTEDNDPYDNTVTLKSASQNLTPAYDVPSSGFLNDVYIFCENTVTASTATATGTGAVGVLAEDGPWNVLSSITFTDTSSTEILGPITGFDLYVIDKFGGYMFSDDPKSDGLYTATTNATASSSAAGSFSFMLRIPAQLVPRDALGSLPNKSQSTPYRIKIQVAPISDVYVSASTVGGSMRIRMVPASYWEPTATDGSGNPIFPNPPAVNTTQYWQKQEFVVPSGRFTVPMTNGVGYPIRNLLFVHYSDDLTRATGETEFPDDFLVQLQSNIVFQRFKAHWKRRIFEDYGYAGTGETAGQKNNGCYVQPYCRDFGPKPGWETRRGYLRTSEGMKLLAKGNFGGAGKIVVLTNFVGIGAGSSLAAVTT